MSSTTGSGAPATAAGWSGCYGDRHPVRGPNGAERPGSPGQQALTEALVALEAQADRGPLDSPAADRGARGRRSTSTCAAIDRAAVEVDASGWRVVREPPVRFVRPDGMLPLPVPVRGDGLELLRGYSRSVRVRGTMSRTARSAQPASG